MSLLDFLKDALAVVGGLAGLASLYDRYSANRPLLSAVGRQEMITGAELFITIFNPGRRAVLITAATTERSSDIVLSPDRSIRSALEAHMRDPFGAQVFPGERRELRVVNAGDLPPRLTVSVRYKVLGSILPHLPLRISLSRVQIERLLADAERIHRANIEED